MRTLNLESFKNTLIGWKKAGPSKKPHTFWHVNRLIKCSYCKPINKKISHNTFQSKKFQSQCWAG